MYSLEILGSDFNYTEQNFCNASLEVEASILPVGGDFEIKAVVLSAARIFPTFWLAGIEKLHYSVGHALADEKEMEKTPRGQRSNS